jgi:hypothetical protein
MVTLRSHPPHKGTPEINARLGATGDLAEVISRTPTQFVASTFMIHGTIAGSPGKTTLDHPPSGIEHVALFSEDVQFKGRD